jgi:hypothetical protein
VATGSPSRLAAQVTVRRQRDISAGRLLQLGAIGLSLALLLGLLVSYATLVHTGAAGPKKTDFIPYFSAAHLVNAGNGDGIYSFHQMGQFESALVRPLVVKDGVMPYLYPPYFAVALTPLARFPYTVAYLVWVLLNLILLLGCLVAWQRYAGLRGGPAVLFWAAALSFLPVLVGLAQGQTSIVLLALFTGVFFALRAGREFPAGCLLACALIKPSYVVPVLAVLLLRTRWRAILAFLVTALALMAAPVLALGTSINSGYGATLLQAAGWQKQIGGFESKWNHSFSGLAELLLPGAAATIVAAMLCLVAGVVFLVVTRRSSSLEGVFGLAIVTGLVLSPHVLVHDLTLLIIPAALALRLRPSPDRALAWVLSIGYGAVLAGLALVTVVPVQWSVLAMSSLGVWLANRAYRPAPDAASVAT